MYMLITKTMFGSWKVQRKEKEVSRKTSEQTYKKVIKLGELECYVAFSYRNNQQWQRKIKTKKGQNSNLYKSLKSKMCMATTNKVELIPQIK